MCSERRNFLVVVRPPKNNFVNKMKQRLVFGRRPNNNIRRGIGSTAIVSATLTQSLECAILSVLGGAAAGSTFYGNPRRGK